VNGPIRRLAAVVAVLFAALLMSTSYVQYVQASALNARPGNARTNYKQFGQPRGSLLVAGRPIAESIAVKDSYGYLRRYPGGAEYAPVTGYFSLIFGTSGMEGADNDVLSGASGQSIQQKVNGLLNGQTGQVAAVSLTINPKVQAAAWKALGNQRGAVVALDPSTGAVLALVSKPSFNPNVLAGHDTAAVQKAWAGLLADPGRPLDNRAIASRQYAPGSVFKVVTASAALSSGNFTPDSQLAGPAVLALPQTTTTLPNDFAGPCAPGDSISMRQALQISCNTAFASLGMTLGETTLQQQAQAYGFGQTLRIPLNVTPSTFPMKLSQAEVAQSSIGQFDVRVTPMQVAMVSAAIANHGVLMKPYLVDHVQAANLDMMSQTQPQQLSQPVTPQAAADLTTMMEGVVTGGTGTRAQIPGVRVAGKTGTAQQGAGQAPNVWFTAFAPADNPKIAVAVVVEDGGVLNEQATGGQIAAPMAKKVIQALLQP
jgi:peptidoglycan glycosyltransferase